MPEIPKILHACWFGDAEMSRLNHRCMESWRENCPDFEIKIWKDDSLDLSDPVIADLYRRRKWAFLTDFKRFEILRDVGGIYLDTDMEFVRPLPAEFTSSGVFFGKESKKWVSAGIIGAQKGHAFVGEILDRVRETAERGVLVELPKIVTRQLAQNPQDDILIAPKEVFYPYNPYDADDPRPQLMYRDVTDATICIHHWEKTWKLTLLERMKRKLSRA